MDQHFTPYSDNIIFLDTEFSSLDPYQGEILSIGIIKLTGEELYIELEYDGPCDDWVKENILPTLNQPKISRQEAIEKIKEFIGNKKPYVASYINQFDTIYLYKLFKSVDANRPVFWIPIDFASILFGMGIRPESYSLDDTNNFLKDLNIDTSQYHHHHALDDAKLLRDVYLKMTK